MKRNSFKTVLFLLSLFFIFCLTMLPFPSLGIGVHRGGINIVPFRMIIGVIRHKSLSEMLINNAGNIALFIPFGLTLPLRFPKLRRLRSVALSGTMLSIFVECIQLLLPLRWTDIDDVILNSLGTMIGFLIFTFISETKIART